MVIIPPYPRTLLLLFLLVVVGEGWSQALFPAWRGLVQDDTAQHIAHAMVRLDGGNEHKKAATDKDGKFLFKCLLPQAYQVSVSVNGRVYRNLADFTIPGKAAATLTLQADGKLLIGVQQEKAAPGGEHLTSKAVSEIPLNKRDFSQLLLLAAGTAADSSRAYNFTQQFAINGQRGVEAVFAFDGADSSDPELGGGTFTNFKVDAVLELQSRSGVMPAEIGRGASGITNVLTRSGSDALHGSVFEFLRNSSLDARNYFDYSSPASPGRIPPFKRNEFGFTNGGPILIPLIYDGRGKAYYFGEYPGATAGFAQFEEFTAAGVPVGGFGTESVVTPTSHSNYHALQLSAAGPTGHGGPGIQASYTYSKSIDDTSSVGGTSATSTVGAIAQAAPQNPFDTHGTSTSSLSDFRLPTGVSFMSEMSNS